MFMFFMFSLKNTIRERKLVPENQTGQLLSLTTMGVAVV